MEFITSRNNPKIKFARALRRVETRRKYGCFLVEGIRHVGEAAEAYLAGRSIDIRGIYYAPERLTSTFSLDLINRLIQKGVVCTPVSEQVFLSLAEKENPPGIIAIVSQPNFQLKEYSPGNFSWGVAVVSPQDPGNVGAIIRSIDAVGACGLILLDGGTDAWHPGSIRASMGTIFWKPVIQAGFNEFSAWINQHGYAVYGSSAQHTSDNLHQISYEPPMILLLGSERQGLTSEQRSICKQVISLPMEGRASSLNLAVAAGILLYAMKTC